MDRKSQNVKQFLKHHLSSGRKYHSYNPHLPSLRRMDMDDVGKKEPHEHSRTTTYLRESTIF